MCGNASLVWCSDVEGGAGGVVMVVGSAGGCGGSAGGCSGGSLATDAVEVWAASDALVISCGKTEWVEAT